MKKSFLILLFLSCSLSSMAIDSLQAEKDIIMYFQCISSTPYEEGYDEQEIKSHYQEALKIGTFLVGYSTILTHAFYSQLGKVYFKLDQLDSAQVWYEKAYRLDTNSSIYISNMATVTFSRGNYAEALHYFLKAHKMNKKEIDFVNNVAACYGSLGEYQTAIAWSMKALEISSNSYTSLITYQSLIISYGALGNKKMVRMYKRKMRRLKFTRGAAYPYNGYQAQCPKPKEELIFFELL